jgi:hypothetical protein
LQFTYFGRNTSVFVGILQDAHALSATKEQNKTTVYTIWGGEWREFGQPRAGWLAASVVLGLAGALRRRTCRSGRRPQTGTTTAASPTADMQFLFPLHSNLLHLSL